MNLDKLVIAEIIQEHLEANEDYLSDGFGYYSGAQDLIRICEEIAEKIIIQVKGDGKELVSRSGAWLKEGDNLTKFGMIGGPISRKCTLDAADSGHYVQAIVSIPMIEHTALVEQYDLLDRLSEGVIGSKYLEDMTVEEFSPEEINEAGYLYYRVTGKPGLAAKEDAIFKESLGAED